MKTNLWWLKRVPWLGLVLMIGVAQGASFDCAKASTKVEHIICDSPEISKLDDELAASYKAALQDQSKARQIKQTQRQWLSERSVCQSETCLKKSYQARISELSVSAGATPAQTEAASSRDMKPAGEYVLRATAKLHDAADNSKFCEAFTANLNEFRELEFDTCDPRLSPKFPRFSRPQWEKIPLDMDMVKRILANRPSIGFERWLKVYDAARSAGEVKLWKIRVDLLKDGNLDTLIRLDHAGDGTQPYCSYFDSKQMIVDIPEPEASKWYTHAHFDNFYRLGGDLIYDANTKRYFAVEWRKACSSRGCTGW